MIPATSRIDFRTDALSAPTEAMWEAMRRSEFDWAPYGEDRAVNELEARVAELLGKESALLVSTCSMANLLALMTLSEPGSRVIAGETSHIVTSEAWSIGHPLGLFPHLVDDRSGIPEPAALAGAIAGPMTGIWPRVGVICLENSHNNAGGAAIPATAAAAIVDVAHRAGASVHLDGARLFNSAVALDVSARALADGVDTVAVSLSKGLAAPWGAVLCGTHVVIETARTHARRIGAASVHKAGIFAAAGLVAIATMSDRLTGDQRRAADLARRLATIPGLRIVQPTTPTNLVLVELSEALPSAQEIVTDLARQGVLVLPRSSSAIRFALHHRIGDDEVRRAAQLLAALCTGNDDGNEPRPDPSGDRPSRGRANGVTTESAAAVPS